MPKVNGGMDPIGIRGELFIWSGSSEPQMSANSRESFVGGGLVRLSPWEEATTAEDRREEFWPQMDANKIPSSLGQALSLRGTLSPTLRRGPCAVR